MATTRFTHSTFSRARPPEPSEVILLSQQLRFEPAHLTGAGGILVRAFPANGHSNKGPWGRRSASLVSPYPAKRQHMDCLVKGIVLWQMLLPVRLCLRQSSLSPKLLRCSSVKAQSERNASTCRFHSLAPLVVFVICLYGTSLISPLLLAER